MTDTAKGKRLTAMAPIPIQLLDHESSTPEGAAWCKDVMIGEYTVVNGTNMQRFVVWTVTITTTKHSKIEIRKRYTDFVEFREALTKAYPNRSIEIPRLPPKSVFLNFDNNFLEKRRNGLEFFMSSVLLNPSFAQDPIVKQFIIN